LLKTIKIVNFILMPIHGQSFFISLVFIQVLCNVQATVKFMLVLDKRIRNIPEVILVRRRAVGFWEFGRGGVG
jgi:hypothetical protein